MPGPGGILALDIGVRVGWCYGGVRDNRPDFGGWALPASGDLDDVPFSLRDGLLLGARGAALENELSDFMALTRPRRLVFAVRFAAAQTTAYLLTGLAVAAEIQGYRSGVQEIAKLAESEARKHVLGRGSFGDRDPSNGNKIIKGSGTPKAKAAALSWCNGKGWNVGDEADIADACVIWEFDRRGQLARRQWGELRE